jgi:TRAP-type C4-dicarboxylate transport system permease small subunit
MNVLRAIDRKIAAIEKILLFVMLALIVGVNVMQIGLRLLQSLLRIMASDVILSIPSWPDVNRLLVLWICMVGGSLATQRNEHIKVDFFSKIHSGGLRRPIGLLISFSGTIVSGLLIYFSINFLRMEYELGETLVAIPIPLWYIQIIIPIGFLVISYRFLILFLEALTGAKHPREHTQT